MTLPENALKYDTCSLQELRKFVTDRNMPFKYTHPQGHTKKSQRKQEMEEKRKLLVALERDDATKTFRLLDLPRELRDEVYYHYLSNMTPIELLGLLRGNVRHCLRLQYMSGTLRDEMCAAFDKVWPKCTGREKRDTPSFDELCCDLGARHTLVGGGMFSPAFARQMSAVLQSHG